MSVPPCDCGSIIIFGSSGDLAERKLLPALAGLDRAGRLLSSCRIVGFSRSDETDAAFRERIRRAIGPGAPGLGEFLARLRTFRGDYADPASFIALGSFLRELEGPGTPANRLFYLAVPPASFLPVIGTLSATGLAPRGTGAAECGWTRVVVEKPIGHDLESALAFNETVGRLLDRDQVYLIDHYLAKETVQNILVLRFGNGLFEPLWNRHYIDHVQVTIAETGGIGRRGSFYDQAGALRDIAQNHLLQLLALVAMEPPSTLAADALRDAQASLLNGIRPPRDAAVAEWAVRGQYGPGILEGAEVAGYRQEARVAPDSPTETFVALRLSVDNPRWAGVPFLVRTGKRLATTVTEVAIRYQPVPHPLFRSLSPDGGEPNELILRIQPDEGITIRFGVKAPGPDLASRMAELDFSYARTFGTPPPPAYERVITDALRGDTSLFLRGDAVEASWRIVQPVLESWRAAPPPAFPDYAPGSWGPPAAVDLAGREGRRWRIP